MKTLIRQPIPAHYEDAVFDGRYRPCWASSCASVYIQGRIHIGYWWSSSFVFSSRPVNR